MRRVNFLLIVSIAIAMTMLGAADVCAQSNDDEVNGVYTFEEESYDYISKLSINELEAYIEEANFAIEHLEKELESDESNPEDRFYARITLKAILEQRELYTEELERRKRE